MTEYKRRQVKDSQEQERRGARAHGGRTVSGSGSQVHAKGDVRIDKAAGVSDPIAGSLIEYKRTDGKGLRLTTEVLSKIQREALLSGRRPLLGFEIGGMDWIAMPVEFFNDLEDRARACGGTT